MNLLLADLVAMVPVVIGEEAFEKSRKVILEGLLKDDRKCLSICFDEIGQFVELG